VKLALQTKLLMWKRYNEIAKQRSELLKLLVGPMLLFSLMILIYVIFPPGFFRLLGVDHPIGFLEAYFVPLCFWIVVIKTVIFVVNEKHLHLQESMRMMGMMDLSYYLSLFVTEGLFYGLFISLVLSLFSLAQPLNDLDGIPGSM